MNCKTEFIEAKYHLSVVRRMMSSYEEYPDKRFIVGIINESAIVAIKIIKTFLMAEKTFGGLSVFEKKVGPKYLQKETIEHLIKILKIKKAQNDSLVEIKKGEKIILLIDNEYRILTIERLKEFLNSLEIAIKRVGFIFRQI